MTKEIIEIALKSAFQLGQTYWRQADSDRPKDHDKSDDTMAAFKTLVTNTITNTAQPVQPASAVEQEPVAWKTPGGRLVHAVERHDNSLLAGWTPLYNHPPSAAGPTAQPTAQPMSAAIEANLWTIKEWAYLHLGAMHNVTIAANSAYAFCTPPVQPAYEVYVPDTMDFACVALPIQSAQEKTIDSILEGIDKDSCEDDTGWFGVSTDVAFGASKLAEIKAFFASLALPVEPAKIEPTAQPIELWEQLVSIGQEVDTLPPERNFCETCGQRLGDVDHIHTCSPPESKA